MRKELPRPKLDLKTRNLLRQNIDRYWSYCLSPSEYKIVIFVFDRTVMWGLPSRTMSHREFEYGSGEYTYGCGLKRRAIQNTLKQLVYRGTLIRDGEERSAQTYGINIAWEPEFPRTERKKRLGKVPNTVPKIAADTKAHDTFHDNSRKLAQSMRQTLSDIAHNVHQSGAQSAPLYKEPEKKDSTTKKDCADGALSRGFSSEGSRHFPCNAAKQSRLEKIIEADVGRGQARRRDNQPSEVDNTSTKVREKHWAKLMAEHWSDTPLVPWSPKTRGLFKQRVKDGVFTDIVPGEFFEWVIDEWGYIRNVVFDWMPGCPISPEPEFVMVQMYPMLVEYSKRMVLEHTKPGVDDRARSRTYIKRRRGFNSQQAEKYMVETRKHLERVSEAEERLRRKERGLNMRAAIMDRAQKYQRERAKHVRRTTSLNITDEEFENGPRLPDLPVIDFDEDMEA